MPWGCASSALDTEKLSMKQPLSFSSQAEGQPFSSGALEQGGGVPFCECAVSIVLTWHVGTHLSKRLPGGGFRSTSCSSGELLMEMGV